MSSFDPTYFTDDDILSSEEQGEGSSEIWAILSGFQEIHEVNEASRDKLHEQQEVNWQQRHVLETLPGNPFLDAMGPKSKEQYYEQSRIAGSIHSELQLATTNDSRELLRRHFQADKQRQLERKQEAERFRDVERVSMSPVETYRKEVASIYSRYPEGEQRQFRVGENVPLAEQHHFAPTENLQFPTYPGPLSSAQISRREAIRQFSRNRPRPSVATSRPESQPITTALAENEVIRERKLEEAKERMRLSSDRIAAQYQSLMSQHRQSTTRGYTESEMSWMTDLDFMLRDPKVLPTKVKDEFLPGMETTHVAEAMHLYQEQYGTDARQHLPMDNAQRIAYLEMLKAQTEGRMRSTRPVELMKRSLGVPDYQLQDPDQLLMEAEKFRFVPRDVDEAGVIFEDLQSQLQGELGRYLTTGTGYESFMTQADARKALYKKRFGKREAGERLRRRMEAQHNKRGLLMSNEGYRFEGDPYSVSYPTPEAAIEGSRDAERRQWAMMTGDAGTVENELVEAMRPGVGSETAMGGDKTMRGRLVSPDAIRESEYPSDLREKFNLTPEEIFDPAGEPIPEKAGQLRTEFKELERLTAQRLKLQVATNENFYVSKFREELLGRYGLDPEFEGRRMTTGEQSFMDETSFAEGSLHQWYQEFGGKEYEGIQANIARHSEQMGRIRRRLDAPGISERYKKGYLSQQFKRHSSAAKQERARLAAMQQEIRVGIEGGNLAEIGDPGILSERTDILGGAIKGQGTPQPDEWWKNLMNDSERARYEERTQGPIDPPTPDIPTQGEMFGQSSTPEREPTSPEAAAKWNSQLDQYLEEQGLSSKIWSRGKDWAIWEDRVRGPQKGRGKRFIVGSARTDIPGFRPNEGGTGSFKEYKHGYRAMFYGGRKVANEGEQYDLSEYRGKFYDEQGQEYFDMNIGEATAKGYVPSVTTLNDALLGQYKYRNDRSKNPADVNKAAEFGTGVHSILENYFTDWARTGQQPAMPSMEGHQQDVARNIIDKIAPWIESVRSSEQKLVSKGLGLGGTVDLVADMKPGAYQGLGLKGAWHQNKPTILDFKTSRVGGPGYNTMEHQLQLYHGGKLLEDLQGEEFKDPNLLNIYASSLEKHRGDPARVENRTLGQAERQYLFEDYAQYARNTLRDASQRASIQLGLTPDMSSDEMIHTLHSQGLHKGFEESKEVRGPGVAVGIDDPVEVFKQKQHSFEEVRTEKETVNRMRELTEALEEHGEKIDDNTETLSEEDKRIYDDWQASDASGGGRGAGGMFGGGGGPPGGIPGVEPIDPEEEENRRKVRYGEEAARKRFRAMKNDPVRLMAGYAASRLATVGGNIMQALDDQGDQNVMGALGQGLTTLGSLGMLIPSGVTQIASGIAMGAGSAMTAGSGVGSAERRRMNESYLTGYAQRLNMDAYDLVDLRMAGQELGIHKNVQEKWFPAYTAMGGSRGPDFAEQLVTAGNLFQKYGVDPGVVGGMQAVMNQAGIGPGATMNYFDYNRRAGLGHGMMGNAAQQMTQIVSTALSAGGRMTPTSMDYLTREMGAFQAIGLSDMGAVAAQGAMSDARMSSMQMDSPADAVRFHAVSDLPQMRGKSAAFIRANMYKPEFDRAFLEKASQVTSSPGAMAFLLESTGDIPAPLAYQISEAWKSGNFQDALKGVQDMTVEPVAEQKAAGDVAVKETPMARGMARAWKRADEGIKRLMTRTGREAALDIQQDLEAEFDAENPNNIFTAIPNIFRRNQFVRRGMRELRQEGDMNTEAMSQKTQGALGTDKFTGSDPMHSMISALQQIDFGNPEAIEQLKMINENLESLIDQRIGVTDGQ